jgi:Abortive infection C-terminus
MKLAQYTINKLADLVCGGANGWPYRRGADLVEFFNQYGLRDVYEAGFPSRTAFAKGKLTTLAPKPEMAQTVCDLVDPRHWHDLEQDVVVPNEACVAKLNELLAFDNYEVAKEGRGYKLRDLTGALVPIEALPKNLPGASALSIETQIKKCRAKIEVGDFDGAITNARALIEHLLLAVEAELSMEPPPFDGDMGRLFNRVRSLLNLDTSRKDISDSLKQVLTGLTSIVQGLSAMRNKMSDSHGTTYKPARHHAKLAVNCAMTLADFIFESKAYQEQKGLLTKHPTSDEKKR